MSSTIEEYIATIVFLGGESSDVHKRAVNAVIVAAKMQDSDMDESLIIEFLQAVLEELVKIRRQEMEVDAVWADFRRIKMNPAVKFNDSVEIKTYELSKNEKRRKRAAADEANIRSNVYQAIGTDQFAQDMADMAVSSFFNPTKKETLVW